MALLLGKINNLLADVNNGLDAFLDYFTSKQL